MKQAFWCAPLLVAACSGQPQPAPRPTPSATPAGAIPAALQGRYATDPATCAPGAKSVRGLLTIGGDAIAFGATPQTVDRVAPREGRVVFDTTDTSGEMTERRRYAFQVSADGTQLTRQEPGRPDLVYTRCPNQPS